MGTASAGAAAGCGSSGTAIHQQQGGVDNSPTPVGTDKRAAEGPKTHEATPPAAAATGPERGAHVPAGAAAAAVSHGVPVKLEPHCDKQHQHCSLAASAPAAVPTAAAGASAAVGLASGASCRPQVQAGAPRVVEADEAADALLMLSR
jgi:hypothetical protein